MNRIYIKSNITSEKLLAEALFDLFHIKDSNIQIIVNEYGKKYLKDYPNIYFNISHSGDKCVCVISDNEVGVDIQKKCYKPQVYSKCFNSNEIEYIENSKDKEKAFTKCWVMKESYVKMLGIGISYGLKNVNTLDLQNKFDIIELDDYFMAIGNKNNF